LVVFIFFLFDVLGGLVLVYSYRIYRGGNDRQKWVKGGIVFTALGRVSVQCVGLAEESAIQLPNALHLGAELHCIQVSDMDIAR